MSDKQEGAARERPGEREGNDRVVRPATAWHPLFYGLMDAGAPPSIEIRTEIVLSQQPRRADLLLLQRKDVARRDREARVLRGLWPLLGPVTLAEFKGPKSGFRSHDLLRLLGYGMQYNELNMQSLAGPAGLTLALLTPAETPSLRAAIDYMGWRLEHLGNGYARIEGAWYTTFVAFIDEVCEAERDDYLRLFSRHRTQIDEAVRWLNARCASRTIMEKLRELEGYDDVVERLLSTLTPDERLAGLRPEERLAGLRPEERLAGLRPEERLAGLRPEERLAGLRPEERLAGLGPEERLAGLGPEERLAGLGPEERLAGLGPEERLAGLRPEEVLRHYGLEQLLVHLRDLAPAERTAVEGSLPAPVLEALRKYVDGTR